MIAAFAIFFATLIGKLAFDRHLHFSRKTIKHKGEAVIVCIALAVASGFVAGWHVERFYYFPMFLFLFWAPFDFVFGLLIARDPFFLGTTALLDRAQQKYRSIIVAKYVLFLTSLILFITL